MMRRSLAAGPHSIECFRATSRTCTSCASISTHSAAELSDECVELLHPAARGSRGALAALLSSHSQPLSDRFISSSAWPTRTMGGALLARIADQSSLARRGRARSSSCPAKTASSVRSLRDHGALHASQPRRQPFRGRYLRRLLCGGEPGYLDRRDPLPPGVSCARPTRVRMELDMRSYLCDVAAALSRYPRQTCSSMPDIYDPDSYVASQKFGRVARSSRVRTGSSTTASVTPAGSVWRFIGRGYPESAVRVCTCAMYGTAERISQVYAVAGSRWR